MESNRKKVENKIKKNNMYLIPIVILAIIIGLCIYSADEKSKKPLPDPIKVLDTNKTGEYASMDIQMLTESFATNDVDECHFAMDKDNYICIVVLNKEDTDRLQQIKEYTYSEDEVAPKAVTVKGVTQEITDDLKKIAIESYNEIIGDQLLNNDNFEEYIGNIYLDTKVSPIDYSFEMGIGILSGTFLFILLIYYLKAIVTTKSTLKKYTLNGSLEYIYSQLDQLDTQAYANGKIFLTREYIIDISNGLVILKYDDIKWIYPYNIKRYGITVGRYLEILNFEKKKFRILATEGIIRKNKLEEFETVYIEICKRAPNSMHGYTQENLQKSKNF